MSVDIKINDFPKVCRLCLRSTDLQSIFQDKYRKVISTLINVQVRLHLATVEVLLFLFISNTFLDQRRRLFTQKHL